jgi:hypothetical protein
MVLYVSLLRLSGAWHLGIFEKPECGGIKKNTEENRGIKGKNYGSKSTSQNNGGKRHGYGS